MRHMSTGLLDISCLLCAPNLDLERMQQANAVGSGTGLAFRSPPEPWRSEFTPDLYAAGRICQISIIEFFEKGARCELSL